MLRRRKKESPSKMGSLSQNGNSQSRIEIRGVETIEEFFRPEFTQNTQSLDDIGDSDEENTKGTPKRTTKSKKMLEKSKMGGPFPQFSDNSSSSNDSPIDISNDNNKAGFRNMGFPNMNYLDPDANGPPL